MGAFRLRVGMWLDEQKKNAEAASSAKAEPIVEVLRQEKKDAEGAAKTR